MVFSCVGSARGVGVWGGEGLSPITLILGVFFLISQKLFLDENLNI